MKRNGRSATLRRTEAGLKRMAANDEWKRLGDTLVAYVSAIRLAKAWLLVRPSLVPQVLLRHTRFSLSLRDGAQRPFSRM